MSELTEREAHSRALSILNDAKVPYAVAGAVALGHYTGIWRQTKDLDIFLTPADIPGALEILRQHGYETEIVYPHWLAKAHWNNWFVDLIYGFGDWRAQIDELWITRAHETEVYGMPSRVIPPEELLWTKAYVMHRERFDGADISHILLATVENLDWQHLLWRFGPDWELLLGYLNLFHFVYPSERHRIPQWVWDDLLGKLSEQLQQHREEDPVCRGTLLDRYSYLPDVESWGFWDERTRWAVRSGSSPAVVVADRRMAHRLISEGEGDPAEVA